MATTQPTPQGTGGNILGAAFMQYGQGTGSSSNVPAGQVSNPTAQYEYGQAGRTGKDTDGDGFREVDCSVLVLNGLRNAGYNLPGVVPNSESVNFTTRTLFTTPTLGNGVLTDAAKQNFNEVAKADLKPGDIVLFAPTKAGNAQHMGIYYGQDAAGNAMFYGSQSSTGPGVAMIVPKTEQLPGNYWGGANATFFTALRPKPELYVPEMDLTGGPGTGLSSDKVIAAVNLLKSSNVEGYRANIYSNNTSGSGDGVPTVGNGLALVVKGGNGWVVRPENEIRDILRDAGLPESKYNELPLDKLTQSAGLLNQGRLAEARALFGTGEAGGFSVTPAEADKLSASFVIRNVIPSIVRSFGDAENFSFLEPGEFAAAASKVYQSPGWLQSTQGKNFLDAWWRDDTAAAQSALGTGMRGSAEASAYAGNISIANESLGGKNADGTGDDQALPVGGHWEYPTTSYNAMGDFPTASERVWVADKPADKPVETATPATGTTTSASTPSANTPYSTNSTTTHHKPEDGGGITVNFTVLKTSPNGAMLKGDLVTYVQDADGKTTYQSLRRTVGKETTLTEQVKDPVTGDVVNTKSVWRGNGTDSLQFQEQRDAAGNLVGPRYVKDGEAYSRSEGVGGAAAWLNERGQSEQEWKLDPTNPSGVNSVNGLDSQSDNYVAPQELGFYKLSDEDVAQIRQGAQNILASADNTSYTAAGGGIQTDGGVITGYGSGSGAGGSASANQPLNFSNLTPSQLAQALQNSSTGGAFGAGQMGGNSFVPISATSKVLTNSQGEVIGEANLLPNGYTRFTDASGAVAYTTPGGQAVSQHVYQVGQATAGAGLAQSIISLQNWDKQTTLGQVGTVVGMYNHINTLSEGALGAGSGLGSLGSLGAGLGFLSALESGDVGRSVYSGLSMVETSPPSQVLPTAAGSA